MLGNLGRPYRHDHRPKAGRAGVPYKGEFNGRTNELESALADQIWQVRLAHLTLGTTKFIMPTNENPLEQALRLAADGPEHRPDFYRLLLEAEVYVLTGKRQESHEVRTIAAGEKITIENWTKPDGSPVIPFFSSLEALQRAITEPNGYMGLPARSLFEITQGATLFMNPKLDYGKEFFPDEIKSLLSHGVTRTPEQRVTTKETKVLLGQPKDYPSRMVDSLTAFFAKRSEVKAAFLVQMHDASQDEMPHLVVGIQADGDVEKLFGEAGGIAGDTAPGGRAVDLYRVVPGDKGLTDYFLKNVTP